LFAVGVESEGFQDDGFEQPLFFDVESAAPDDAFDASAGLRIPDDEVSFGDFLSAFFFDFLLLADLEQDDDDVVVTLVVHVTEDLAEGHRVFVSSGDLGYVLDLDHEAVSEEDDVEF
jgi:hypothetical protein